MRRTGGRGHDSAGGGEASAAWLTCSSSSVSCSWSSMPSSCSERRPNCMRRSLAIISLRRSISPRWAVTNAFKTWMSPERQSVAQVMARCYGYSAALNIRPLVPARCAAVGANRCPPTALRVLLSSKIAAAGGLRPDEAPLFEPLAPGNCVDSTTRRLNSTEKLGRRLRRGGDGSVSTMVSTKNGGHHCGYSRLGQAVGAGRTLTTILCRTATNGRSGDKPGTEPEQSGTLAIQEGRPFRPPSNPSGKLR